MIPEEEVEFTCEECGEECTPTVEDQGIGDYEFWGAKCHDSYLALVSDCLTITVLR